MGTPHHVLYSTAFGLLVMSTILYFTRSIWIPRLPNMPGSTFLYSRLSSGFVSDIENGFSCPEFDLTTNVAVGDTRRGLDDASKREIAVIMKSQQVNFNEARRLHIETRFSKNNIGPDGRPRDPKLVCFS